MVRFQILECKNKSSHHWLCVDTESDLQCSFENRNFDKNHEFTIPQNVNIDNSTLDILASDMYQWLKKNHSEKIIAKNPVDFSDVDILEMRCPVHNERPHIEIVSEEEPAIVTYCCEDFERAIKKKATELMDGFMEECATQKLLQYLANNEISA